jgi:hypothetical protein
MRFAGRLLFIIGLGALLMGGFKSSLLLRGTKHPESVTIGQLGALDGTSNVHLTVTDYRFGEHIVTIKDDGRWERVWIPLLTKGGHWTQRPVVAHSKNIENFAQLEAVRTRSEVTGVVSNFMQSLGSNQQREFAKLYPSDDLHGAIAIEIDATMPSPWIAFPMFMFGIVAFPAGLCMLYLGYFRPPTTGGPPTDNQAVNPSGGSGGL